MLCLFSNLLLHNFTFLSCKQLLRFQDFFFYPCNAGGRDSKYTFFWLSKIHISPSDNEDKVLKELHEMIDRNANSYPETAIIILGDFKYCDLQKSNPKFHQFVNFLIEEI